MSKVLISLTPTGKFFFGGDMSFSVNDKSAQRQKEQYASYIIKSNAFPQQTSLLGMLRFLILSNNANAFDIQSQKITNKSIATKLIGERSFMVGSPNSFGVIKGISGCFLQVKKDEKWVDLISKPKDFNYNSEIIEDSLATINNKKIVLFKLDGFDPKNPEYDQFIESCAKKKVDLKSYQFSDIFIEDCRIGINRDIKTGKTDDESLFKQISYRFNDKINSFRFSFYADIDLDAELSAYNHQLVSLGADSSSFVISCEKVEEESELRLPIDYDLNLKVVLTSDAYIESSDLENVIYGITETIPFRFLKTTVNTKSYNKLFGEIKPSERLSLYQSGSVFFFKDEKDLEAFTKALEQKQEFRQIGYNQYKTKK